MKMLTREEFARVIESLECSVAECRKALALMSTDAAARICPNCKAIRVPDERDPLGCLCSCDNEEC